MLKKILAGVSVSALAITLAYAQGAPGAGANPRDLPGGANAAQGRGADANLQRSLPSENQWDSMNPAGKAYVAKSLEMAGNDPDLQFDQKIFCRASGGSQNADRQSVGVPVGASYPPFPSPNPSVPMPGQRMFDNFYWFGDTGVGAWLWVTPGGYVLFDATSSAKEAQEEILDQMPKFGLNPANIKYVVFGHNHLDHTGGGHLIQSKYGARVIMGRDDWAIYFRAVESAKNATTGLGGRLDDKVPMKHDIDAEDGMKITLGGMTATIYTMTGHTPGSIGGIFPVQWQGSTHNILIVTAATDAKNREAFIGGYEHIWDIGIANKAEAVFQVHPNTNMNLLARTKYVNDNYATLSKSGNNPLLYGVDKTRRYIEIMRNCTLARFEALGW